MVVYDETIVSEFKKSSLSTNKLTKGNMRNINVHTRTKTEEKSWREKNPKAHKGLVAGEFDGGFRRSWYWKRASRRDSEIWLQLVTVQLMRCGYRLMTCSHTEMLTTKNENTKSKSKHFRFFL